MYNNKEKKIEYQNDSHAGEITKSYLIVFLLAVPFLAYFLWMCFALRDEINDSWFVLLVGSFLTLIIGALWFYVVAYIKRYISHNDYERSILERMANAINKEDYEGYHFDYEPNHYIQAVKLIGALSIFLIAEVGYIFITECFSQYELTGSIMMLITAILGFLVNGISLIMIFILGYRYLSYKLDNNSDLTDISYKLKHMDTSYTLNKRNEKRGSVQALIKGYNIARILAIIAGICYIAAGSSLMIISGISSIVMFLTVMITIVQIVMVFLYSSYIKYLNGEEAFSNTIDAVIDEINAVALENEQKKLNSKASELDNNDK